MSKKNVQGEGDYESAKKYYKDTRDSVERQDNPGEAPEDAAPEGEEEKQALKKAREEAAKRARS